MAAMAASGHLSTTVCCTAFASSTFPVSKTNVGSVYSMASGLRLPSVKSVRLSVQKRRRSCEAPSAMFDWFGFDSKRHCCCGVDHEADIPSCQCDLLLLEDCRFFELIPKLHIPEIGRDQISPIFASRVHLSVHSFSSGPIEAHGIIDRDNSTGDSETKKADKRKFITKEQEPEQYWQTADERDGKNPMSTPLPYILILSVLSPFIILAVAFANNWIKIPVR